VDLMSWSASPARKMRWLPHTHALEYETCGSYGMNSGFMTSLSVSRASRQR
jgi:hypothetical protein